MREHPITHSPALHTLVQRSENPKADPSVLFAEASYGAPITTQLLSSGAIWKRIPATTPVEISYPEVDWKLLRGDHGWAALQYEALMRTEVHLAKETELHIDSEQVVEYAFVPEHPKALVHWYVGDIYGFASTPSGRRLRGNGPSNFARSISLQRGKYTLLVRALYEIRMFGDPKDKPPTIKTDLKIWKTKNMLPELVLEPGLDVFPDIMEGQFAGDLFAIGVRLPPGSDPVAIVPKSSHARAVLPRYQLFPGQARAIPLRIASPSFQDDFSVQLFTKPIHYDDPDAATESVQTVEWKPQLSSLNRLTKDTWLQSGKPLRITFGTSQGADTNVARAVLLPPPDFPHSKQRKQRKPALLCLHGAGVDIEAEGWIKEIPRIDGMFAILAIGRNEWGEDWHGGAVTEVWAARAAADLILLRTLNTHSNHETVLLGHSNGGQGVWHIGQRYPDSVRGIVALSGYTTIHSYVPYTEQQSNHIADPALMGVLQPSLTPYNNEIYASNLASIPMVVVHGAEDDNVPAQHSRTYIETLRNWGLKAAEVTYVEVPKKGHVWDGILTHPAIVNFLNNLPEKKTVDSIREAGFSLACANPDEMASKGAIRILELAVPGRLARLDVNMSHWDSSKELDMHGMNIKRVAVYEGREQRVMEPKRTLKGQQWEMTAASKPRRYGPMIRLLDSDGPLLLVIPPNNEKLQNLAIRYAHDVRVYQRQDVEIVYDIQALRSVLNGELEHYGNIIVFGRPEENRYAKWMISTERIPGTFVGDGKG